MTAQLLALCLDANDPQRIARFWAGLLDWELSQLLDDAVALRPHDDTGFELRLHPTTVTKTSRNQVHLDLTSTSLEDQRRTVATAVELGARPIDVGQRPDQQHVVLADPEGNEFCVIEPGNAFLADCGFVGALAGDGSQQVGYFWSAALGWPLVWDQDEETAIRSPRGGPKITWGGPPVPPKVGRNRLHFDLAPLGPDQQTEVERLVSLGASRLGPGSCEDGGVAMSDPDGNEFCLLPHSPSHFNV